MKKLLLVSFFILMAAAVAESPLANYKFNRLPTYFTGRIFPPPKKAVYLEKFLPLDHTAIVLPAELPDDDLRARFLRDRIEMNGGKAVIGRSAQGPYSAVIHLALDPATGRKEGYTIAFREPAGLTITGNDPVGLLWGMASAAQMIRRDGGGAQMQGVEATDYPDVEKRGFLSHYWPVYAPEFMIFCKLNTVVFQKAHYDTSMGPHSAAWRHFGERTDPEKNASMEEYGAVAAGLGLDFRYSIHAVHTDPAKQLRCSNEDDYRKILANAERLAQNKLGLYLAFDDNRYPVHPDDLAKFGSGREADLYFVNRLYRDVKRKHPDFRMVWCPPFYWGPTSPAPYPENREEYLKATGQGIDPDIDFFWTGPRVKFTPPGKPEVEWVRNLYGRKPWTFINGKQITHPHFYCYVTDPVAWWKEQLYPGFWQDMGAALINTGGRYDAASTASFGACTWGLDAYDAAGASRQVADLFFGPANFEAFDRLNRALAYFDVYRWQVSAGAARQLPEITVKLKELEDAYRAAEQANPFALNNLSIFSHTLGLARRFVNRLRSNPKLDQFAEAEKIVRADAEKEAGLSKEDILLGPTSFHGGQGPAVYGIRGCPRRLASWVRGSRTPFKSMSANFTCEPFPVAGDYQLVISGQDDDSETPCRIEIRVNDQVIFSGPNGFAVLNWSRREFTVPAACLQRENKLTVNCLEPSDSLAAPPFFMINYTVLKPLTTIGGK